MEEELCELRDLVVQLRADNERLRQEQSRVGPSSSTAGPSTEFLVPPTDQSASASTALTERFVFIPRDRKCPIFDGRSGVGINEWMEEAKACIRTRHLSVADQAFFLFDHLGGEAREEIRHRSAAERVDPKQIFSILQDLYGCSQSYVALQEAFFSRRQLEGETLLEFSLALMGLLEKIRQKSPTAMPNAEILLRDQFVEYVCDASLRRELKQLVRRQPQSTLLDVRSEAIRWEREGMPGGARGRSLSAPLAQGFQYEVKGGVRLGGRSSPEKSEMGELREMLKLQQEQLNQLTQSVARLQAPHSRPRTQPFRSGPVICRRCQKPGHFARECEGERVISQSPVRSRADPAIAGGRQSRSNPASEN
ncbi:Modulator of apoptosis 1 [Labeo rohita]|uniref:Modulator of apoptosis 1 n=1 Tax=Labeo rohita TaxID=84645 RepID=A0ABQ8KZD3_LABRO|nr:Modulator of apoptosis 1 [Labeo rohita]